jgi:hypothetical protein
VVQIDLEYYKTVAKVATTPDVLRAELLDLINEIEADPTYIAVVGIMKGYD